MRRINWDDLRLFAEVARAGSFRRAAVSLKVSEPTVSRRIHRLETELGVKLFRFTGGSTHLTDDGQRVLNHAHSAEHAVLQATDAVAPTKKTSGRCVILAGDGVAAYWLPQFMAAFIELHPHVQIQVLSTRERYGHKPPIFDLRIQYGSSPPEDLVCAPLATVHFTLFGAKSYFMRYGMPSTLEELSSHRLIDLADDVNRQGTLATWLGSGTPPAFISNANATIAETVRHGGGIGFLPTYASLMDADAVPVLTERNFKLPLYLAYERSAGKRPAVRAMIDFLRMVAFDTASMPWFADEFSAPSPIWRPLYERLLQDATQGKPSQKRRLGR